jgi:hypothetical protein
VRGFGRLCRFGVGFHDVLHARHDTAASSRDLQQRGLSSLRLQFAPASDRNPSQRADTSECVRLATAKRDAVLGKDDASHSESVAIAVIAKTLTQVVDVTHSRFGTLKTAFHHNRALPTPPKVRQDRNQHWDRYEVSWRWTYETPILLCVIATLVVTIGILTIVTTAPAAKTELLFGEAVG